MQCDDLGIYDTKYSKVPALWYRVSEIAHTCIMNGKVRDVDDSRADLIEHFGVWLPDLADPVQYST